MRQHYQKRIKKNNSKYKRNRKKSRNRLKQNETIMLQKPLSRIDFFDRINEEFYEKQVERIINPKPENKLIKSFEKISLNSDIKVRRYELTNIKNEVENYNRAISKINEQFINDKKFIKINEIGLDEIINLKTRSDLDFLRKNLSYIKNKDFGQVVDLGDFKITKLQKYQIENKQNRSLELLSDVETRIAKYYENPAYFEFKNQRLRELQDNFESLISYDQYDKTGFERFLRRLERFSNESRYIEKDRIYKENYIKGLKNAFGNLQDTVEIDGKRTNKLDYLINKIESIDPQLVYDIIGDDDTLNDPRLFYEQEGGLASELLNKLYERWIKNII